MCNSLLQKLLTSGDPDLVELLLKEFPDLFDYGDHTKGDGSDRDKRISFCIDKVKNDLIAAKSASFLNPPSNFEHLPKLIEVSRQKAILLSPSPSLALRTNIYFVRVILWHLRSGIVSLYFLLNFLILSVHSGKSILLLSVNRPPFFTGTMLSTNPSWSLQTAAIFQMAFLHLEWEDTSISKVGR